MLTPLYEADDVLPLAVGHHQLVPLVLLQAQTLQRVVLDKVHPDKWHIKSNRLFGLYISILTSFGTFYHDGRPF